MSNDTRADLRWPRPRRILAGALIAATATVSGAAYAQDSLEESDTTPSGGAMVVDLLFARPLGLAATVLGSALYVVSLPFDVVIGDYESPARKLVEDPAKYTFTRPLGQSD